MKSPIRASIVSFLVVALSSALHSQQPFTAPSPQMPVVAAVAPMLSSALQKKVGSARLFQHARKKQTAAQVQGIADAGSAPSLTVAIYRGQYPSIADIADLERLGVRCTPGSWIPPLEHHPLGFFLAKVPVDRIADVLSLPSVLKMDSAEGESVPENNLAAVAVKATLAWAEGWTGSGVKVAVLDSGLDYTLPKTELPDSMWYRDYAFYPDYVDNSVSNMITGHGTHVTGTVLGKGGYSTAPVLNTANGGGAYKGMAPDAKLVFLKIGDDTTANATTAAIVAAIKSAVDTFNVRVINMSYGGWDAYHDGSDEESQTIDYAFSKGVACIIAAGNNADKARHYSGTVAAGSTTDDIMVTIPSSSDGSNIKLAFNLVWADGISRKNLSLAIYDQAHNLVSGVTKELPTESPRGTESQYSYCRDYLPAGAGTYYLRVTNPSDAAQLFHIYVDWWGSYYPHFASPDPAYTVLSPAYADHAFAVAAYSTREGWAHISGSGMWGWWHPLDQIAPFSSRGPRIDGVQKPNIAAPGTAVISIRDRDVYSGQNNFWIDNDGTTGGAANYYAMQGTSMASPVVAGCAALLLQHSPNATPQQLYESLARCAYSDSYTGPTPNSVWGAGKIDVDMTLADPDLPVELAAFSSRAQQGSVLLTWRTATETNNYGFEIERKVLRGALSSAQARTPSAWERIGFVPGHGTSSSIHEYVFTDIAPAPGLLAYRLKQIDRDGRFTYSRETEASAMGSPAVFSLAQNYPNPFNPSTTFLISVPAASRVRLALYDVLGREISVLVDRMIDAGVHRVEWNASAVPSGVYFCRFEAGTFSDTKKLMLQK